MLEFGHAIVFKGFWRIDMQSGFWKTCFELKTFTMREEAQDLVEYALVLSLVAVGAVAVMGNLGGHLVSYYDYIVARVP